MGLTPGHTSARRSRPVAPFSVPAPPPSRAATLRGPGPGEGGEGTGHERNSSNMHPRTRFPERGIPGYNPPFITRLLDSSPAKEGSVFRPLSPHTMPGPLSLARGGERAS